jgi:hypothetical protein
MLPTQTIRIRLNIFDYENKKHLAAKSAKKHEKVQNRPRDDRSRTNLLIVALGYVKLTNMPSWTPVAFS